MDTHSLVPESILLFCPDQRKTEEGENEDQSLLLQHGNFEVNKRRKGFRKTMLVSLNTFQFCYWSQM